MSVFLEGPLADLLDAQLDGRRFSLLPYAGQLHLLEAARDGAASERLHMQDVLKGEDRVIEFEFGSRDPIVEPDDQLAVDELDHAVSDEEWLELNQLEYHAFDEAMRMRASGGLVGVEYVTRFEREARQPRMVATVVGVDRDDVEPSVRVERLSPVQAERREREQARPRDVALTLALARLHERLSVACATAELVGDPADHEPWHGPLDAAVHRDLDFGRHTDAWLAARRGAQVVEEDGVWRTRRRPRLRVLPGGAASAPPAWAAAVAPVAA